MEQAQNARNKMVRSMIQNTLDQQQAAASTAFVNQIIEHPDYVDTGSRVGGGNLENGALEEFKKQVRQFWELDIQIKRLAVALKERKKAQNTLSQTILEFMQRHNIEDLNTKDGVLRYKTSYVRAPLSQKTIKEKLSTYFQTNPDAMQVVNRVFEDRERVEKVSLRRLQF